MLKNVNKADDLSLTLSDPSTSSNETNKQVLY